MNSASEESFPPFDLPCRQTRRRLDDLLDTRRTLESDPELVRHLDACPPCQALADNYLWLRAGIDTLPNNTPPLPIDFASRVLQATTHPAHRPQPTVQSRRLLSRIATVAACAAVLLLAAWPIWNRLRPSSPTLQQTASPQAVAPQRASSPAAKRDADAQLLADQLATDLFATWENTPSVDAYDQVWRSTGRTLAGVPGTVTRVSSWSEHPRVGTSLRPVVVSVSATLDAFLQVWPTSRRSAGTPQEKTGSRTHDASCQVA